jgi:hypothetical protein
MLHRRKLLGLSLFGLGAAVVPQVKAHTRRSPDQDRRLLELYEQNAVKRLFSEYVRAVIRRDGDAVQSCFAPSGMIRNFTNRNGELLPGANPMRAADIGEFVNHAYHPYSPGMWGHIYHAGEIIDIADDRASYSSQVAYANAYALSPEGQPLERFDLFGHRRAGEVVVTNCGMWEAKLSKSAGAWKIDELSIIVDIPYVA